MRAARPVPQTPTKRPFPNDVVLTASGAAYLLMPDGSRRRLPDELAVELARIGGAGSA